MLIVPAVAISISAAVLIVSIWRAFIPSREVLSESLFYLFKGNWRSLLEGEATQDAVASNRIVHPAALTAIIAWGAYTAVKSMLSFTL